MPLFVGTVSKCRVKHIGQHLFKEGWFDSNTSIAACASGVLDLGEDRKNRWIFWIECSRWKWWNRDLSHVGGGHFEDLKLTYLYCSNIMDWSMIDPWFVQLIHSVHVQNNLGLVSPKKIPGRQPATCIGSQKTQPTWQIKGCDLVTFTTQGNHLDISWLQFGKFGERSISYVKMWNHLIETPIWMFQINDGHIFFTWFETTISSWNFNVFPPPLLNFISERTGLQPWKPGVLVLQFSKP